MTKVGILDCTLRDGGYVNNFSFDNAHTFTIINQLQNAGIDIVECGFLDSFKGKKENSTRFDRCETINILLKKLPQSHNSLFVAMAEFGEVVIDDLPAVTETKNEIKGIRFSFRKSDHRNIFDDAQKIIDKGYKLFIQPIATELYADQEILDLIDRCNAIGIDSMYIVDTHGSMMREDFRRIYYLFEHNLNQTIRLGFHSHNNLQLSYSNAIDFIEIANSSQREIIIDASIYGMGRGAGNLNTELLADYINKRVENRYKIEPLLEVVDEYLVAIYKENRWGYSLEHFLSASEHCHPNYASYLINKKNLSIVEIKKLLASVSTEERREFNKMLIEQLYVTSKEEMKLPLNNLPASFYKARTLLIASGRSVETGKTALRERISQNGFQTVGLNHINPHIACDYLFFSNQLRYDGFCEILNPEKLIVTSNIKIRSNHQNCFVADYKQLFEYNSLSVDNATVLILNLLSLNKVQEVSIAGLDGYDLHDQKNYSYTEYNRVLDNDALQKINDDIARSIRVISQNLHISYVTPSQFKQHTKQKIIGVIPSRFSSTRLPGKPLKEIAGLPMVIHVLKRAQMSEILDEVIVATDDRRIYDIVEAHGGKAMMTDMSHNNGSERMYEVSRSVAGDIFAVINGDEALLKPEHIDAGIRGLLASDAPVSLLYNRFEKKNSPADFKVVLNNRKEVMYISRNDIPSDARTDVPFMYKAYHVMSFTKEFLETYMTLEQTPLDRVESHELLRVLENGYKIQGIEVASSAISVDTPEDLEYVRSVMSDDPIFKLYGVQE
jgi:3-deoxy-D-manno-octulosonate cytidylyltransferase